MPLPIKDEFGPKERPVTGMVPAVCSFVADIGTHTNSFGKTRKELVIIWEIEQRLKEGEYAGKRFLISKRYAQNLGEKSNLTKDLQSWMGHEMSDEKRKQGIDLEKFQKIRATLNLVASESGFVYPSAIMPAQQGNNMVPECVELQCNLTI